MKKTFTVFALFIILALFFNLGCNQGGSSKDIAKELDEILSDSMSFEGGETIKGPAPEGSVSEEAPQISDFSAPTELVAGRSFSIIILTAFPEYASVDKAIISVGKADRYIKVSKRLSVSGQFYEMTLNGTLESDARLFDHDFAARVALQTESGKTGLYRSWKVKVPAPNSDGETKDGEAEIVEENAEAPEADGGTDGDADEVEFDVEDGETDDAENEDYAEDELDVEMPSFAKITPGTFNMGSPSGANEELGRLPNETLHAVTLTYGYYIMTTETTQGQFLKLMGYNPANFKSCGLECPVELVSWHEACAFANALSESESLEKCYSCAGTAPDFVCSLDSRFSAPQECKGYRLPTEAEWEFAARAGGTTAFYSSDGNDGTISALDCEPDANLDQIGWYCGNGGNSTKEVKQKEPNAWGLYDVLGNVWEWAWDAYCAEYETYSSANPRAAECGGSDRVNKGGSYGVGSQSCRLAARGADDPAAKSVYLGFRLVKTEDVPPADGDEESSD